MKVLLIEPDYHTDFLPLGLAKVSTFYKKRGDEVKYIKSSSLLFEDYKADKVMITSLFTWDYKIVYDTVNEVINTYPNADIILGGICASLVPEKFNNFRNKIQIIKGSVKEYDKLVPDFKLFNVNYVVFVTTRGCKNKCAHCMVPILEPIYKELNDWDIAINKTTKKIYFWDNNFLAASVNHIKNVIEKIKQYNLPVDFNQGLDAELFTEQKAKLLGQIRVRPLRFAWDNHRMDKYLPNAIKLAIKYTTNSRISVYMLYNFFDKPVEIYNRLKIMSSLYKKMDIFPMRYQPLDAENKGKYIGKYWSKKMIQNFNRLRTPFANGVLRFDNENHFKKYFGKTSTDFMNLLSKNTEFGEELF